MRKSQSLSEELTDETTDGLTTTKCTLGVIKCMGIIIFCGFTLGISFYSGIQYTNYLNDNSESF